jgi:hypothetical protein
VETIFLGTVFLPISFALEPQNKKVTKRQRSTATATIGCGPWRRFSGR